MAGIRPDNLLYDVFNFFPDFIINGNVSKIHRQISGNTSRITETIVRV